MVMSGCVTSDENVLSLVCRVIVWQVSSMTSFMNWCFVLATSKLEEAATEQEVAEDAFMNSIVPCDWVSWQCVSPGLANQLKVDFVIQVQLTQFTDVFVVALKGNLEFSWTSVAICRCSVLAFESAEWTVCKKPFSHIPWNRSISMVQALLSCCSIPQYV